MKSCFCLDVQCYPNRSYYVFIIQVNNQSPQQGILYFRVEKYPAPQSSVRSDSLLQLVLAAIIVTSADPTRLLLLYLVLLSRFEYRLKRLALCIMGRYLRGSLGYVRCTNNIITTEQDLGIYILLCSAHFQAFYILKSDILHSPGSSGPPFVSSELI